MKPTKTTCPITKVATILSDTWTMLIMHALLSGPKHFCELERELEGISTRTLTLKLKRLEEERLLMKNKAGIYVATKRGQGLKVIESAMRRFEEKYL